MSEPWRAGQPVAQPLKLNPLGGITVASTTTIVTLGVQDLKRSIRFYEAGLGFPRVPYEPETIAFFDLGGAQLALFPRNGLAEDAGVSGIGEGFRGVSLARFLDSSQEVDAFLERAVQAGGTLTRRAQAQPWGGYSGYFADLDGHLWEIGCDSKTYAKERAAAQQGAAADEPQRDSIEP